MNEEKIKKKMTNFLDFKYKKSKVVQNYKELFVELMTAAYMGAIHDMQSQDNDSDIQTL